MPKLAASIEKELSKYFITLSNEQVPTINIDINDHKLNTLLDYAKTRIANERDRVALSMLFRRYAFVITAQLYLLSKHRLAWQGSIQHISIIDDRADQQWLPTFLLHTNEWQAVEEDKVSDAMKNILTNFGASLLEPLAAKTKTSRFVLWENIWGYTLWMYDGLLKETEISTRVENDLSILLGDEVWQGVEKRSPFKTFLGDKTVPQSVQAYKRVTCCFYYEIEGNEKCPYCPNATCTNK